MEIAELSSAELEAVLWQRYQAALNAAETYYNERHQPSIDELRTQWSSIYKANHKQEEGT